ncbi:MAG: hypothetical protein M1821_009453 [Bathelium mastoideum]|nr:MAG: hypothetical protein M1821_009453 [Bathelium mastoideum]
MDDLDEDARGLLIMIKDTLLAPLRTLTSKSAQRAYVNTALLFTASAILAVLSLTAALLFHAAYVPRIGFDRAIHLQFPIPASPTDAVHPQLQQLQQQPPWPVGVADLGKSEVVSRQAYDVSIALRLPRSPANVALGNFMLDLELLADESSSRQQQPSPASQPLRPDAALAGQGSGGAVLARSSRSAMLTYRSSVVEQAGVVAVLPLYTMGWKTEAETLEVGMMEGIEFRRGWGSVPRAVRIRVRTDEKDGGRLQVYGCSVKFVARLKGLRWFMYKHRIISLLFFTTTFWTVSSATALLAYLTLTHILSAPPAPTRSQRARPPPTPTTDAPSSIPTTPTLSDTSRTFPTLRPQPPLHFSPSTPRIKPDSTSSRERDHDSGLGSSLPEDSRATGPAAAPAGPSSFAAAWARTEAGSATNHYPTPEPEESAAEDGQEGAQMPGEAADDEGWDDEDGESVVDGLGEAGERRAWEGTDVRDDLRESVRRRRSRLFASGAEGS